MIHADRRRLRQALVIPRGSAERLAIGTGQVRVEADVLAPQLRIRVSYAGLTAAAVLDTGVGAR